MLKIKPGLYQINWETKKGITLAYRVVKQIGKIRQSKVFHSLEEADNYLTSLSKNKDKIKDENLERLFTPTINHYLQRYIREELAISENMSYQENRRVKNYISMLNKSFDVVLEYRPIQLGNTLLAEHMKNPRKRFRDFELCDFDHSTMDDWIRTQKTHLKSISVLTYKTQVLNFFEKIRQYNMDFYIGIKDKLHWDKKSFKDIQAVREFRTPSEEEMRSIYVDLAGMNNPQNLEIFCFGLFSAMRISEIIGLKWEQVDKNFIHLPKTKTGARDVYISDDLRNLLDSIDKIGEGVFTLTTAGFLKNFQDVLFRTKMKGKFTFHMLRKIAITKNILALETNPLIQAKLMGIKTKTVEKYTSKEVSIDTLEGLKQSWGHRDTRTSENHYVKVDTSK